MAKLVASLKPLDYLRLIAEELERRAHWLHVEQLEGRISSQDELQFLDKMREWFWNY